jgi:hypothetical protein
MSEMFYFDPIRILQMNQSPIWLELYKCVILTVIAVALIALYLKTPVPFTIENIRNKKVEMINIPLVRVHGGHVDAN